MIFSQALNTEIIKELAEMTNGELLTINQHTELWNFKETIATSNQQ